MPYLLPCRYFRNFKFQDDFHVSEDTKFISDTIFRLERFLHSYYLVLNWYTSIFHNHVHYLLQTQTLFPLVTNCNDTSLQSQWTISMHEITLAVQLNKSGTWITQGKLLSKTDGVFKNIFRFEIAVPIHHFSFSIDRLRSTTAEVGNFIGVLHTSREKCPLSTSSQCRRRTMAAFFSNRFYQ